MSGPFIIGEGCGACHVEVPHDRLHHGPAMTLFDNSPNSEVFLTWHAQLPPTPQTPIPSPLLLMAVPLLWLARKAVR